MFFEAFFGALLALIVFKNWAKIGEYVKFAAAVAFLIFAGFYFVGIYSAP